MSRPIASLFLATLPAIALCGAAADETNPQPPMRLPSWIESFQRDDNPAPSSAADPAAQDGVVTAGGRAPTDRAVRPVADWSDPKPPSPATQTIVPTAGERAAPATPASPAGSFRRWVSERVASLPNPLAPASDAKPAAEPAQPAPAAAEQPAAPTVNAPVAATPDEMPTLSIDPASFRGALPGKTTRAEIEASWGPQHPDAEPAQAGVATWKIEPFDRVEVTFDGDTVATIRVKLAEPVPVADLARQLEIGDLRTVAVRDDEGVEIGEVYPERGVILSVEPGTRQATAILIEPLDPDAFVLRAEQELESCSAYALADLQHAVQIDPNHLRAHRLLLSMATDQGKWTQALNLAERAARLDPDSVWVKLKLAAVLIALDRPAEARPVIEAALTGPDLPPLLAAQAHRLLGRVALAGKAPDHRAAVDHFTESIRRAAPLLAKRGAPIQAPAREILLDAHLGTALAIAEGTWQQKSRVIPKWIVRSEALVKEFEGDELERQLLELQLCVGALEVAAGSTESIEPLPWVKRMLEVRDRMSATVSDPWRRRQIDWDVGQGLRAALAAAEIRGDASDMLDNATLTAAYLERGGEHRELTGAERKDLGDLMFRIGILHSLQRGDHATAVTWFDRAIPLWDDNDRFVRDGEQGRLGESYVSMAISYWQVDRREDALELSRRGVELMVAAVDSGQLEERALAVAYGNLATMHAEQGDDDQSRTYAEMASRAEATGGTLR
ncbi:MAG: tetratricopeptide repeat protein [Planctomycetota bacterium]